MTSVSQRANQHVKPIGTRYNQEWRKTLLAFIPFGALAYFIGWALENPSGQATTFDMIVYPVMGFLLLALEGLLAFKPRSLALVVLAIIGGASTFFFAKLGWLLFFSPSETALHAQFTETLFWIPVVYLLSFILTEARLGQIIVRAFTAGMLALATAYTLPGLLAGDVNWGVVYTLIELNLANTVFLALTSAFIRYKEQQTLTRARMEEAEKHAYRDALTGLANRVHLDNELGKLLERATARDSRVAVMYLDIDGFKVVNDTLGHEAGDELLTSVAGRLRNELDQVHLMARMSGDEFVIVLDDVQSAQAAMFSARKLQAALVTPFELHGMSHHVSASIGICLYPDDASDGPTLLRHADSAMYRVKRSGKNGVQRYRDDSDAQVERQRNLERELRAALSSERDQLSLVYQGIHDLGTGDMVKVEALARWHHPKWGHVGPTEFIPIAERSGLIVSLGEWVLREACRQAKAWEALSGHGLVVSVNVSAMQFAHPGFYRTVEAALEDHALLPELLEIELTEGIVMHGVDHVVETLQRLQRLGVRIAIDDFGTGYSSFAYLRDLPIDTVKIDRSFVKDLGSPLQAPQFALALVEAITHVAKHLDLQIVAEGIETAAQRQVLRDLGCHLGQGYLFSRPVKASEVRPFLQLAPSHTHVVTKTLVN
ncbi:MAG TPA: EAL domain-containing protein [Trueperaceae bacterium]|nr:EAL domain-containing protein [Trueperaceae bacterium]